MTEDIVPLATTFSLIFLAEFGDKTQLTAMMLSSKSSSTSVFAGAMLAFFVVDGLSALVGGELLNLFHSNLVTLGSGLVFTFVGTFSLIRKKEKISVEKHEQTFLKTFSVICLMELGDKTQVASILLAAKLRNPLIVLLGVMLAFSVITGIGVVFGSKLLRRLPERWLRIGSSVTFIVIGLIFIIDAVAGIKLLA